MVRLWKIGFLWAGLIAVSGCGQDSTVTTNEQGDIVFSSSLADGWSMETRQHSPTNIQVNNSNGNNQGWWVHDSLNNTFISPNAWGFGGNAGGTGTDSGLSGAYVRWQKSGSNLSLEWFVGGYHRDYNGRPGEGWSSGGNNVKAYPRMGLGSASGQQNASMGAPSPRLSQTEGWDHVDMYHIRNTIGIPEKLSSLPDIKVNVDMQFSINNSSGLSDVDKYGNYYFAIDSYLHDVDNLSFVARNGLQGNFNGINDSSGYLIGQDLRQLQDTTKRWAVMIWYHEPPYYATSGATTIADNVSIDGRLHTVKYKIETAGMNNGGKAFKYISFVMKRHHSSVHSGKQPTVAYKRYMEYLTGSNFRQALDDYQNRNGNLQNLDLGFSQRITPPSSNLVLSDLNVGVEISGNPDTSYDTNPRPVKIDFRELSFTVPGKGTFGFSGGGNSGGGPTTGNCVDTPPLNDGWGWDGTGSCKINGSGTTSNSQCEDTPPYNDGWGWDGTGSCKINGSGTTSNSQCEDTPPYNDGWGWDGTGSCRI